MRKPPHSRNDERTLIGAAFLSGRTYLEVDLEPSEFYCDLYARVWKYIRNMPEIDQTKVESEFLSERNEIVEAITNTPTITNMHKIAERIRDYAHKRDVIAKLSKSVDMLFDGCGVPEVAGICGKAFDSVKGSDGWVPLSDYLRRAYSDIEAIQTGGGNVNFDKSGFTDFDSTFGGIQKNGLVVVAGRPSMGKSAFASALAISSHKDVLIISMEMSGEQLATRYFASECGVSLGKMSSGGMTHEDWSKLSGGLESLMDSGVYVNDKTSRSVDDIVSESRRFARVHDAGLIVVDYLTLLSLPDSRNKVDAISEATRRLKCLAGEIGCPVVLLSQLNRDLEKRADKRPILADLRDSGAIEQDADQVIFPFRPEVYDKKPEHTGLALIIMAKNRNGPTGVVQMTWIADQTAFKDNIGFDD